MNALNDEPSAFAMQLPRRPFPTTFIPFFKAGPRVSAPIKQLGLTLILDDFIPQVLVSNDAQTTLILKRSRSLGFGDPDVSGNDAAVIKQKAFANFHIGLVKPRNFEPTLSAKLTQSKLFPSMNANQVFIKVKNLIVFI